MSWGEPLTLPERAALDAFRAAQVLRRRTDGDGWVAFGLHSVLDASRHLRPSSAGFTSPVAQKDDGTPVTRLEVTVEEQLRANLAIFDPTAAFVGEELGGTLPEHGTAIAVDPIDGTWAFLGETASWSSTLAVFEDGRAFAGFVANPMTGEIVYALDGSPTRYLRVGMFGEDDFAMTLRAIPSGPKPLVNLQPSRAAADVHAALMQAWQRGEIGIVRAPGGSPAWALVEAARGHFVYANVWSGRPTRPYDLAAAALIVRNAGGDVTDLDGVPIDITQHASPWVAALDAGARARVAAIVRSAWPGA